ncbi:pentapeptide repeat-containing protein [Nocardia huaxiensis]|nr:pentapeptide repeat-containing protein [Nocardia huaxiensis]UFS96733.1 pentapeptide repeat-containing protein [Nocardia huaxiensis]
MRVVVPAVVIGLVVGVCTGLLLLPGESGGGSNQLERNDIARSVIAGLVAAGLWVLLYRWQRDRDRGRFAQLFGAAAMQLGHADVAVRIAGVYAMAGVADGAATAGQRQQCVDVLCGYLRLPYVPDEGASHLVSKSQRVEDSGTAVERVYGYRQNDRQVRDTILRVIAGHLRPSAERSWSDCDFDFSDAIFEDLDFREVTFAGDTRFTNAVFVGGRVTSFDRARFLGSRVSFQGAMFRATSTRFDGAIFAPAPSSRGELDSAGTTFIDATFAGTVSFDGATFGGSRTVFTRATFAGERSSFADATFTAELTTFERAVFDGGRVTFATAEFAGARITFANVRCYAEATVFDCAHLGSRGRWRVGGTREVSFARAECHGRVTFADAVFDGRAADFTGADFFGDISFRRVAFDAREVTFEKPKAWVGVRFDWDESPSTKPANIRPEKWPPSPVEQAELTSG